MKRSHIPSLLVATLLSVGFPDLIHADDDPLPVIRLNSSGSITWETPTIWSDNTVPAEADQEVATHSVEITGVNSTTLLLSGNGLGTSATYRIGDLIFDNGSGVTIRNFVPDVGETNPVVLHITGDLLKQGSGTLAFTNNTRGTIRLVVDGDIVISEGRVNVGASNAGSGGRALTLSGDMTITGTGFFSMRAGSRANSSSPYEFGNVTVADEGVLQLYAGNNGASGQQHYSFTSLNGDGTIQVVNSTGTEFVGNIFLNTTGEDHFSGVIREMPESGQDTVNARIALRMMGDGTLTLSGANTYKGGTRVDSGTVIADHDTALGTGTVDVRDSGRVIVNSGRTLNQNFVIRNGATLVVHGAISGDQSSITFDGAGRLEGSGSIGVAVGLSGTNQVLAPGASPGVMTFTESQQWGSFSYEWQINSWTDQSGDAGIHYDQIVVDGSLDLSDATDIQFILQSLQVNDEAGPLANFTEGNRSWVILSATEGITGFEESVWSISTTEFQNMFTGEWSISSNGSEIYLNYVSAIPEPAAAGVLLIGIPLVGIILRRKNIHKG